VEKALYLWFKHMEEKGETVSGPMLVAKHTRFEDALMFLKRKDSQVMVG